MTLCATLFRRVGQLCCGEPENELDRTVALIRRTRTQCASLQGDCEIQGLPPGPPVEHLRAAEQHLIAVEHWLTGASLERRFSVDTLASLGDRLAKDLGMSEGLERGDDVKEFQQFFPPDAGELLVKAVPSSVHSKAFRHPGKLYISSSRLCFHSCVMGVECSFSVAWVLVDNLRLVPSSKSTAYPVRIAMREEVEFDGRNVDEIVFRIFDLAGLGALHKSSMYFVGSDLFGTIEDGDANRYQAQRTASGDSTSIGLERRSTAPPQATVEALLRSSSIWELQRSTSLFRHEWSAPWMPYDGVLRMKWCALEGAYVRHRFLPEDVNLETVAKSELPPIEQVNFFGQTRNCIWSTAPVDGVTDELGWQYATEFFADDSFWSPSVGTFSYVRRRCWKPTFYKAVDDEEDDWSRVKSAVRRVPTTFMDEKCGGVAAREIYITQIPRVPLAAVSAAIEADNWESPGGLMTGYFKEMGAQELEIGAWVEGTSLLGAVKGKVRSVDMRMPVPPAPMCPKDTRVQSTWHVVSLPDKLVLESVTMSLDVPYGTCFNVISCDTFTDTGNGLKMVRTCGVEFVQSTWLSHLVEANVPPNMIDIGKRLAKVVDRWWTHIHQLVEV